MRHIGAHLLVHRDDAAGTDRDAGRGRIDGIAVGRAPDRHQHAVEYLRLRRIGAVEGRPQSRCLGLEFRDFGLEQNTLVAFLDALLQRPHQVAIGAGHQTIAQFDHGDSHAERIVDAGHLQSDDAAADHQQPFAIGWQFQRAGRVDDSRVIGEPGQACGFGPTAMMHCLKSMRRGPSAPANSKENAPVNFASP